MNKANGITEDPSRSNNIYRSEGRKNSDLIESDTRVCCEILKQTTKKNILVTKVYRNPKILRVNFFYLLITRKMKTKVDLPHLGT